MSWFRHFYNEHIFTTSQLLKNKIRVKLKRVRVQRIVTERLKERLWLKLGQGVINGKEAVK